MSTNKRLERDIESTAASKLLVICVDRDDDVGRKAGITTPVVGRDSCINAAQRLALEDPEDADSNSIFRLELLFFLLLLLLQLQHCIPY